MFLLAQASTHLAIKGEKQRRCAAETGAFNRAEHFLLNNLTPTSDTDSQDFNWELQHVTRKGLDAVSSHFCKGKMINFSRRHVCIKSSLCSWGFISLLASKLKQFKHRHIDTANRKACHTDQSDSQQSLAENQSERLPQHNTGCMFEPQLPVFYLSSPQPIKS